MTNDMFLSVAQDLVCSLRAVAAKLEQEIALSLEEKALARHGVAADVEALRAENAQLRKALEGRAIIERAKGVVMVRYGCSEDEAFQLLVASSRREHRRVREVALGMVTGDRVSPGPVTPDTDPGPDERPSAARLAPNTRRLHARHSPIGS